MPSPALIRLQSYPPHPAPSQERINLGLRAIDPICIPRASWSSQRLPSSFFSKYGLHAIRSYSDFCTIMSATPNKDLLFLSKEQNLTFPDFCRKITFVDFAKKSDERARLRGVSPLGRKEMEAAWIQELFFKFDLIDLAALKVKYVRKKDETLERWCKELLAKAVRKPYAIYGVEKYWEQKKAQFPDLDMERLLDWKLDEGEKEMEMPELEGDDHEIGGVDDDEILGGGGAARAGGDGQGNCDDNGQGNYDYGDAMDGEMEDGSAFASLVYRPRQA